MMATLLSSSNTALCNAVVICCATHGTLNVSCKEETELEACTDSSVCISECCCANCCAAARTFVLFAGPECGCEAWRPGAAASDAAAAAAALHSAAAVRVQYRSCCGLSRCCLCDFLLNISCFARQLLLYLEECGCLQAPRAIAAIRLRSYVVFLRTASVLVDISAPQAAWGLCTVSPDLQTV
jgi:hypothetical protein